MAIRPSVSPSLYLITSLSIAFCGQLWLQCESELGFPSGHAQAPGPVRRGRCEAGAGGGAAAWHACMHAWLSAPGGGTKSPHLLVSLFSPILLGNFALKSKSADGYSSKGTHTLPIPEMPFRITAEVLYLYQGLAVPQTSLEGSFEGFGFPVSAASHCQQPWVHTACSYHIDYPNTYVPVPT